MSQNTALVYDAKGAEVAAEGNYGTVPVAASQSGTLDAEVNAILPTHGRQNIAVQVAFQGNADSCDVLVVLWQHQSHLKHEASDPPTRVALGHYKRARQADPDVTRDSDYAAEPVVTPSNGARGYEVRILNLVGRVDSIRTWTF